MLAWVRIACGPPYAASTGRRWRRSLRPGGGRWGAVTALADGSLGSRTAVFRDGYTDAHDQHGVRVTSLADLKAYVGGVI
jgi:predicted amidohydrolase YtcJ